MIDLRGNFLYDEYKIIEMNATQNIYIKTCKGIPALYVKWRAGLGKGEQHGKKS